MDFLNSRKNYWRQIVRTYVQDLRKERQDSVVLGGYGTPLKSEWKTFTVFKHETCEGTGPHD